MRFNRLDRVLSSSLFLKGLSLVVAFFLWFYVSGEVGGESVREYLAPVEYRNVPAGLELKADLKEVRLQVVTGSSFLSLFNESDVRAEVDLMGLEPGRYRLNVRAILPSGMRLVSASQSMAEVELTRIVERVLPLKAEVKGGLPPGFLLESVEIVPAEIMVRGPEEIVSTLKSARLEPQIDELRHDGPLDLAVVLPDLSQARRSLIQIVPERATLSAKVLEGLPTRKLPVRPRLVGEVNRDYSLAGLVIEPAEVAVQGPITALEGLAEVTTEAIDLSKMGQGTTLVVPLASLPEELDYGTDRAVQVQVLLESRTTTRLYASVPVKLVGRSVYPGWRLEPEVVDVVIEGIPSQLDALSEEGKGPEVVVDVTNIVSKKLKVPVQVKLPTSAVSLIRTEPAEVTVYALLE